MLIRILLTCLCLFITVQESVAQRKKCSENSPCIILKHCPTQLALFRKDRRAVIKNICGFSGSSSKVCCTPETTTVQTPETTTVRTPDPVAIPKISENPATNLKPEKCGFNNAFDRIIGGTEAKRAEFPWMVALGYEVKFRNGRTNPETQFQCGGSLINNRYVLTAAHCIHKDHIGTRRLKVLHVGDWDLKTKFDCEKEVQDCTTTHIEAGIEDSTIHPDYEKRAAGSDDIALLRMDITVEFTVFIRPICLPTKQFDADDPAHSDGTFTAAGWGLIGFNRSKGKLLKVNLDMNSGSVCDPLYRGRFVSKQLCVGGDKGKDTCSGDSGSPLITVGKFGPPYVQVGIVAYGFFCGSARPGVYTDVSSYIDWIQENMRQ